MKSDGKVDTMVAATITVYQPNVELLRKSVDSIIGQVDKLVLVFNSIESEVDFGVWNHCEKIIKLGSGNNVGIAGGINIAIRYCMRNGIDWLLTLDQDSICPPNIINEYNQHIGSNIGIVTCGVEYNNQLTKSTRDTICIDYCISSGSYLNIRVANDLGGMDERMFIDQVDFEYCCRLINSGYKILQVSNVVLYHQLGDLSLRKIGPLTVKVGNHSVFRKYYVSRNLIYLIKRHPKWRPRHYYLLKIMSLILKTVLFEDNKWKKCVSIMKGITDGFHMEIS